jgi:hypothetical protein
MDSVHKPWTSAMCGPWWTDHHGLPWSARPPWENDEGTTGIRFWSSPKTEMRRGGGAAKGWTAASGSSSVVHDGH